MSRTWLITGASSGFGRLLAERVTSQGDHVIAVARRSGPLNELAATAGGRVTPIALDLTSVDARPMIEAALEEAGGLDVLINNAGYGMFVAVEQSEDAAARAQMETNFFAAVTVLRAALPALRASRGRIVQVSSVLGQVAWPGTAFYSASKSALELVSDALIVELEATGVQVCTIQPGIFGTEFASSVQFVAPTDAYSETVGPFFARLQTLPTDAYGDPSDVVDAILAVVAHPKPPRRVPVGQDAIDAIRASLQSQLAEINAWDRASNGNYDLTPSN